MNFSTLCTILMTFGTETSEFTDFTLVTSTFCGNRAKIGISCKISQNILDLSSLTLQVL